MSVAEGYVIASFFEHIPIDGRSITQFIQSIIRDRETSIPTEQSLEMAKAIKEGHCCICPDIGKNSPSKTLKQVRLFKLSKLSELSVPRHQCCHKTTAGCQR